MTEHFLHFSDIHLSPIALDLGLVQLRWYSLAYIAGIIVGWWYLLKLLARPGAPMARRHADDLVFYATLGILLGGRLGYAAFYAPRMYAQSAQQVGGWFAGHWQVPELLRLWDGGMSLHGGVIGTVIGIWLLCRKHGLSLLRVCDYVACCCPFGLLFGRLANFVNGELWGRETIVPWAIVFPRGGDVPRHPSQLYEAGMEGIILFSLLAWLFWRTGARYRPGLLLGVALIGYGISRVLLELVREPDAGVELILGLTRGQLLTVPMLLLGIFFVLTARARRERVEPIAGSESVA